MGGEALIFPTVGLNAVGEIKDLPMGSLEVSKDAPKTRTMRNFLGRMQEGYGPTQEVERIENRQQVIGFKHNPEWSIRAFWQLYRRVMLYAKQTGAILPVDLGFTQATRALTLAPQQQHVIIAHSASNRVDENLANFQDVTINCPNAYASS